MIVVDTDVVKELMRAEPDERVVAWATQQDGVSTTTITVAEIEDGLTRLPLTPHRAELTEVWRSVLSGMFGRVLPFDSDAALRYAQVLAAVESEGRFIPVLDAQIAAICLHHGATLATRNTSDYGVVAGLPLVNPWAS